MKSKPWHSLVDDMIAERAMTVQEVYNALEAYYFTPVYDPKTRRSVLRRGRAWFPRLQQVKGYLTHSGKFSQTGHGTAWRLKGVHLKSEQFAFEEVDGRYYNKAGYEMLPIGWQPGTGYRDESYPSGEVYRTYDEAVEWIRNQERAKYQDSLNLLLNTTKLYVYDIEYSGLITDHPDWRFPGPGAVNGRIPSEFGHEAYHWYPGWRYNSELREYVSEPIPELPSEVLMQLKPNDSGIRTRNAHSLGGLERIIQNYLALLNDGQDATFSVPYRNATLSFADFMGIDSEVYRLVQREQRTAKVLFEEEIDNIITRQLTFQTGGIPVSFKWSLVDNYWFNDINPQIAKKGVLLSSDVLSNRVNDGLWLTELENLRFKSSDDWDCTEDMNVDNATEYRERMLYAGCAGNSATYFTYPGGGNYPYYVEPVVLDL